MKLTDKPLCVIGLGYVGLPLAVEFGRRQTTVGFDIGADRVAALKAGDDRTGEVDAAALADAAMLTFASDPAAIAGCATYVVCVPTPVDAAKNPDLSALRLACELVGGAMRRGAVVIFESTVYPGCTEEFCAPILERVSGLVYNRDFFCGYSPERINPGDTAHRLPSIVKVTSGSTPEVANAVDELYRTIVAAGTHRASSIMVAEAAKVIENTQRDLNIALMNELSIIFSRLGIDTTEVLEAAGTKWNFMPFRPGLVGGHCIGVDPYYLTHKAQQTGYTPEVILAGRRINDGVGEHVANQVLRLMLKRDIRVRGASILILGLAFKENCRDIRNTKVVDIVRALSDVGAEIEVHDPLVAREDALREYGIDLAGLPDTEQRYDAILVAVAHHEFAAIGAAGLKAMLKPAGILYDVKSLFAKHDSDGRL